jgi:hypothetical protein
VEVGTEAGRGERESGAEDSDLKAIRGFAVRFFRGGGRAKEAPSRGLRSGGGYAIRWD